MSKNIYISADYDVNSGDRNVVEELYKWDESQRHSLEFTDMAKVAKGSVANDSDCRICDLKNEFNNQINKASVVIFVVGDKTASRISGSACNRVCRQQSECLCTPYKQNTNGQKLCKVQNTVVVGPNDDVGPINVFSYLKHEFKQAEKKNKTIIVVYNSVNKQPNWLPDYLKPYENRAFPFWTYNAVGNRVGNYQSVKDALGI